MLEGHFRILARATSRFLTVLMHLIKAAMLPKQL
jgi:hypothetical protein